MRITVLSFALWALVGAGAWADDARMISVMGQGTVEAVPDMATISIGVTQEADEAAAALAATSARVRDVLSRMESEGIASRDMQTQGLSLQPIWSNMRGDADMPPRIVGFVARNGVVVRVRDLAALGRILDLTVQDGANGFDGLLFGLQDPEPVQAEARKAAVRDAMQRAADLAEAAGVTLGPIRSITESSGFARPMQMEMSAMRSSADVPIASGEVGITAQVSMVFTIAE
jgi:uncharacterized protein YggE